MRERERLRERELRAGVKIEEGRGLPDFSRGRRGAESPPYNTTGTIVLCSPKQNLRGGMFFTGQGVSFPEVL